MPFKSKAQRRWMHANEPKMANRWEDHTPKGKKLPERVKKKKSKTESFDVVLGHALEVMCESRRMKPAVIIMNRGTSISAHHCRIVKEPKTGLDWIIVGIDPGKYSQKIIGGYKVKFWHQLRDFFAPGDWVPGGRCDETGWCEPEFDGHYNATRDYVQHRKFRKILTIIPRNVKELKWLEDPVEIAKKYEQPRTLPEFGE